MKKIIIAIVLFFALSGCRNQSKMKEIDSISISSLREGEIIYKKVYVHHNPARYVPYRLKK